MMSKKLGIYVLVITFLGLFSLGFMLFQNYQDSQNHSTVSLISSTGKVTKIVFEKIELAETPEERERGLMNRKYLCQTCGMLFVFEKEQILSFWMKNTYISLDMIFMDSSGKINKIHKNTTPLDEEKFYKSEVVSKYVLEVPAGYTDKYDLKEGDTLSIENILKISKPFDFGG